MRLSFCLASIALAGFTVAQSDRKLGFTSVPASVQAGSSYNIEWGGGDEDLPVTITLRKGDVDEIRTIQVLTTNAEGNSYEWKPLSSLVDGDDYTLQITQGLDSINFSGEIELSGGIDPVSATLSAILASASEAIASANATITALAPLTSLDGATRSSGSIPSLGTGGSTRTNTSLTTPTLTSGPRETETETETETESGAASTTPSSSATSTPNAAKTLTYAPASAMAVFGAILGGIAYAL